MKQSMYLRALLLIVAAPTAAFTQTVDQLIDQMLLADQAGLNDIDNYMLKTNTLGMTTAEYFEKESSMTLDNGETVYIMRNVPPAEIQQRQSGSNALSSASPEELERAANDIERAGRDMEAGMRREIESAGLPGGIGTMIMNPPPDEPWLSANPRDTGSMYATMLRAAAEGKREEAARDPVAETRQMRDGIGMVKARSRIVGREKVGERDAIIIEADDINQVQESDGRQFRSERLRLWLDAEKSVPLRMRIDGVMTEGSESRPMAIEREDRDYRTVPGCGAMYRPFSSVMRISGLMSAEEEAQLRDAQLQMADMEKQLASMPPAQRDMVMRQMGPQLKMLENMAAGKGIEVATAVVELRCNTGLPDPLEMAQVMVGGALPAASTGATQPASAGGAIAITNADTSVPAAATEADGAALQTAREACLQEKIAAAQLASQKKRGFGKLLSAVSRTAGQLGNTGLGNTVSEVNTASATADDLAGAARDLGITEGDIAACENPG